MGCSTSKGVKSPVNRAKDGWESVLPKEFSVHMERSVKSTEVGYITAIFSANYSNMMMNSTVRSDDLSLAIQPSGVSHQSKGSKLVGADVSGNRAWSDSNGGGSLRKARPDTRVRVPKLLSDNKQVMRATRSRDEPAETINTWELMQGLEDDAELASLNAGKLLPIAPVSHSTAMDQAYEYLASGDGYSSMSVPVSPKLINVPGSTSSPVLSRAPSIGGVAASPSRPKSFTSIRCIEDVDAHIAARSRTSPPVWPENASKIQPIRQVDGDTLRQTTDVSTSSPDPIVCTVSAREEARSIISKEQVDWSPNNLQRALSFKYIFSNASSEGKNTSGQGSTDFQDVQSDTTPSTSDYAACLTGLIEQDGPSFRPSPEFSGAASLEDWLPVFCSLSQPDSVQTGARRSLLGALEGCSRSAADLSAPQCKDLAFNLRNSERAHSIVKKYGRRDDQPREPSLTKGLNYLSPKYCGSDDELLGLSSTKGSSSYAPSRFSSDSEGSESPVFCPEVLESFGNVSKNRSEEDWYTVTTLGSESEGPGDLLRPMKSLRRRSSNSVDGLDTTATGDTTVASSEKNRMEAGVKDPTFSKPVDYTRSKIDTEERECSVTQACGEMKRVSSEAIGKERIVLYSTTWQSNAQAYEDCTAVKTILLSLGTSFDERNISVHAEYEQELEMPPVVPTLRVNGRCFVGLDGILQLHRKGTLGSLLREAECGENLKTKTACLCRGGKFLICPICKGRRKVGASACRHCSGTGLIKCPNCSSF